MNESRPQTAFVDLLDRLLDRGAYLRADLIVTVAGVPLIGASLQAVLGGIETLLSYGLFREWDAAIRDERSETVEHYLMESPAALWSANVNDRSWVRGTLAITQESLVMRDGEGALRLELPFSGVLAAAVYRNPQAQQLPGTLLRLKGENQELWLSVHHLKSIVAALNAKGVRVSLTG
jgi:hypothetical protein